MTRRTPRGPGGTLRIWAVGILVCLGAASCSSDPIEPLPPQPESEATENKAPDRSRPPLVAGVSLPFLDANERPNPPEQWGGGAAAIPSGRWWTSVAAERGITALWSYPLLLRLNPTGRADLGTPTMRIREDGYPDAEATPSLFFEFGNDVDISVLDEGAFHVRFRVRTATSDLTVTMVQGSPLLEVEGSGSLPMTIPGRGLLEPSAVAGVSTMATATGAWLTSSPTGTEDDWSFDGDAAELRFGSGSRWVLGPAPTTTTPYLEAVHSIAAAPLITTTETVELIDEGGVRQTLRQVRESSAGDLPWTLLPHQRDHSQANAFSPVASIDTPKGILDIVLASELTLEYPPVPILWDPVAGAEPRDQARVADLPPATNGSYFGGKYVYTAALASQFGGDDADDLLTIAVRAVEALADPGRQPRVTWESNWGSVVISPAEFGSATELNDHQLQYGYWVAAASIVASSGQGEIDERLLEVIDLLIADYGGAQSVPQWQGVVPPHSTWSAYDGHSWAAGTTAFGSGNNLESISESSFSWWAAARWFIATGRAELAEPFIARLTIESWLTHYHWLPTAENQWPNVRPWSGVVWASKIDPGTWFHPSPEAALGIRLLPVGPQSFSRYPHSAALQAASTRWQWCDDAASGCLERWGNLLDSDAAVARRQELPPTAHPEESTLRAVAQWWRTNWETTELAIGWSCTPGTIARRLPDGTIIALLTNPGPTDVIVRCWSADGQIAYETSLGPNSSRIELIG